MSSKKKNTEGLPSMREILELAKILKKNGDKVLSGASKLSLSTKLLHDLKNVFAMIVDETQDMETSFQVCNSSKIDVFRDLKFLHDFVQKTVWLKVSQGASDPKLSIDISKFRHLRVLELHKVCIDLVTGIQGVRGQLESISCTGGGGVGTVGRLLAACGGDAGIGFVWGSLSRLALPYNGLARLDKSLELAPWLQTLDLSHNLIANATELSCLQGLKYVNLGFNKLEAAPMFNKATFETLHILVLKNNYIENINHLQELDRLAELDLSYNCLTDHSVLWPLKTMPSLVWLSLEGNPLAYHKRHRLYTIKHLHWLLSQRKFVLDRQPLDKNEKELVALNRISMLRSKYLPSMEDHSSLSDSIQSGVTSASVENSCFNDLMASQSSEFMNSTDKGLTRNRRRRHVSEAVIMDNEHEEEQKNLTSSVASTSYLEMSTEHLEMKKQILALRTKYGHDKWLVSDAGLVVQDIMGLERSTAQVTNSGPISESDDVSIASTAVAEDKSNDSTNDRLNDSKHDDGRSKSETSIEEERESEELENTTIKNSDKTTETERDVEIVSKTVEVPYDPEEEKAEIFLVQKKSGQNEMIELFLAISPQNITEGDAISMRVTSRWSTSTVLSCVMGRGEAPSIDFIFDTTRADRQNRTYFVEKEDAAKIVKIFGELIKARPIVLKVFKCMKCSTHFSHDPDYVTTISMISICDMKPPKCPTCRSTLVIQTDELQTPDVEDVKRDTDELAGKSEIEESFGSHQEENPENIPNEGNLKRSASLSSIDGTEGGALPIATSLVHFDSRPQALISCSATSLDESRESTPSASTIAKRYESDIEVLSNPSQSSIEVLDDGTKATSTPSRKRSSEERRIAIAPTLLTIPDTAPAMAGLTESSSSGSLTDSICTTYENKVSRLTGSGGKRQPKKNNEIEVVANVGPTKDTVTTPVGNLTSMLGGLLQSMKIGTNKGSLPKAEESSEFLGSDIIYSYTDFTSVDHRIKLHLILNVFEQENEDLVMFLRAVIVMQASAEPFQGCLVMSTSKIYVLKITGREGEDPQRWLHKEASWTMDRLRSFAPLPFKQGVLVEVQLPNRTVDEAAHAWFLCILQDFQRTSNFLLFLADLPLPPSCELDFTIPGQCNDALYRLRSSSKYHREDGVTRILALFSSATLALEDKNVTFKFGGVIVTKMAILLTGENIQWLLPGSKEIPNIQTEQAISNLIEVIHDNCSLGLSFLDEVAGAEELWTLVFVSIDAAEAVIKAIQPPWEELFSVPLQITIKGSESNQA